MCQYSILILGFYSDSWMNSICVAVFINFTSIIYSDSFSKIEPEIVWCIRCMNNTRDTNYFIKNFANYWYGERLLVNEKMILIVGLDENQ